MLYTEGVVYLTTALNVIWATLGFLALLAFFISERRGILVARGSRVRRFAAVSVIVLSLFPCVSASDDILGLAELGVKAQHHTSRGTLPDKSSLQLSHLLQALENLQIATIFFFACVSLCFGFIFHARHESIARQLPCLLGRAPPAAFL